SGIWPDASHSLLKVDRENSRSLLSPTAPRYLANKFIRLKFCGLSNGPLVKLYSAAAYACWFFLSLLRSLSIVTARQVSNRPASSLIILLSSEFRVWKVAYPAV